MAEEFKREMAEAMVRLRLSQILINEDYKAGKFKVPIHLAMGHEAIALAVHTVLREEDFLVLTHRNMAYHLARLGELRPLLDEYFLRASGLMQGRLGSMNVINPKKRIIYSSSILGNDFPVSAGIAMAEKVCGRNGVTFVLGGDGSIEEGGFYESLLMMKSLGLQALVIIENNEWSLGTHITERRCPIDLKKLTDSLGVPYHLLEGNHVHNYIETLASARAEVMRSGSLLCIEVKVKTLGDRRLPPSPEFPEGKYINYHAGPTPAVDVARHFPGGILCENEDDPLFVLSEEVGREEIINLSHKVMKELQKEIV